MDEIEPDDLGYSDTAMDATDWSAPLEELKADADGAGGAEPEADDAAESAQEAGVELVPYRE